MDTQQSSVSPGRVDGRERRSSQRGQVLVLFVLISVVMLLSVALVTDVAWLWVNQQRMQRAADAAALAGAIYLPGDVPGAYAAALAEATRNGYTTGSHGIRVVPQQNAKNRRRLDVVVSGNVDTFFSRVLCIEHSACLQNVYVAATGRAEYVLPVPMGSPQNYYGVGDFVKTTTTTSTSSGDTGWHDPTASQTASPSGSWASAANAYTWANNLYATSSTASAQQQFNNFGLQSVIPTGQSIDGIRLMYGGKVSAGASCQLQIALSWNAGTSWSTQVTSPSLPLSNTVMATLGNVTDNTTWGAHVWVQGDLNDANFRVRVAYVKNSGCGTVSLDGIRVDVAYHKTTTTTTTGTAPVQGPTGSTLASQGFWGAVITKGGDRQNGDQFDPFNDTLKGRNNPDFDPNAIDYLVELRGSGGVVKLFDPTFCETGPNGSGGYQGAGDHWIAGTANKVTTTFELWNTNGTPYTTDDDSRVATSGSDFAGQKQADYSGNMGTPSHSGLTDCSTDPYHNAWYTLASGLSAGSYRLNVSTNVTGNESTNAENMWSVWVSSSGTSRVYGQGRMVAYNNLSSGTQLFYLAQIDKLHAGKTMQILLFDPGDVSGNAYLRILSPDGNSYNYATFSYTADNGRSGTNVNVIQTASSGGSYYNDALIDIEIPLPPTYGSTGTTPSGETEAGWWKIEYTVSGGNDTTTWQVAIRGSPVHLVVP
jgi:Flp pilus assembly protein TadG